MLQLRTSLEISERAANKTPLLILCWAVAAGFLLAASLRAQHYPPIREILAQPVTDYQGRSDFGPLLNMASDRYHFPLGLELGPDALGNTKSFRLPHGTVEDLLDLIVGLMPAYQWAVRGGVINVMPRDNPDSVLEVRIHRLQLHELGGLSLGQPIASLPEIKAWLEKNGVVQSTVIAGIFHPFEEPLRISVDAKDTTLREILNSIVRTGQARVWSVVRYGRKGEFLHISAE